MKNLRRALAVGFCAAVIGGMGAGAATAQDSGPFVYQNNGTGACLDAHPNGEVYPNECNGSDFQRWHKIHIGHGEYLLRNAATGRCLTHGDWNTNAVHTAVCHSQNPDQAWLIFKNESGTHIQEANDTGRMLQHNPNNGIDVAPPDGSDYQSWDELGS